MNRIVLIGNGFDLAHGLATSYKDFIDWYWTKIYNHLSSHCISEFEDKICTIKLNHSCKWDKFLKQATIKNPEEFYNYAKKKSNINIEVIPLFKGICDSLTIHRWVDIENIYYNQLNNIKSSHDEVERLNKELDIIRSLLTKYLSTEIIVNDSIRNNSITEKILEPINPKDVMVSDRKYLEEHYNYWYEQDSDANRNHLLNFLQTTSNLTLGNDIDSQKNLGIKYNSRDFNPSSNFFLYPDDILFLNFNYTKTAELYHKNFKTIYIHGKLENPESIIFGYGDELDKDYQTLRDYNDNEYLKNIKSVKYLETDNYRNLLAYIESAPYQIYIMGHSCGNSDRTLLNTLFEHPNCVSIKPFYHIKDNGNDNYLDIVQNISRNFTDMKQMRNKVVNKTYCELLPQANK